VRQYANATHRAGRVTDAGGAGRERQFLHDDQSSSCRSNREAGAWLQRLRLRYRRQAGAGDVPDVPVELVASGVAQVAADELSSTLERKEINDAE
jgi:hypothetical protein